MWVSLPEFLIELEVRPTAAAGPTREESYCSQSHGHASGAGPPKTYDRRQQESEHLLLSLEAQPATFRLGHTPTNTQGFSRKL